MTRPDVSGAKPGLETSPQRRVARLKRRAEFQRVSRGRRAQFEAFTLQANRRPADEAAVEAPRVGLTVTKKVGNAVVRNRIRRRLKEALRLAPSLEAQPDHDYVLMARREALGRDFAALLADVGRAFSQIHRIKSPAGPARAPGSGPKDRDKRS